MRISSSLPTVLKFAMVTLWTMMLKWSYIGEGSFWCIWTTLQMFWRILQYTPITLHLSHFICIWLHSFWGLDLCLFEPQGGPWWSCLLWSRHVCHVFQVLFRLSLSLCSKVPLCYGTFTNHAHWQSVTHWLASVRCSIIKVSIQAVTMVTNHDQSYNRHVWMDT